MVDRWTMPEAFREWKERMDAAEAKSRLKHVAPEQRQKHVISRSSSSSVAQGGLHQNVQMKEEVKYESHEAAVEAFKQLLGDNQVSTSAKMKEVMDTCSGDPRWNALKSQGERKQALAEYQVRCYWG